MESFANKLKKNGQITAVLPAITTSEGDFHEALFGNCLLL
jgi:hypothetical protein